MIELVTDAKEFFEKEQIGKRCLRYFSIFSYPLDKSKQRLPINCENKLLELCDKWQIFGRKQIPFVIVGKDKSTVIGQIVEELDRDGNVDGNRDSNGEGGVVEAVGELRNKCSSFPSLEVVLNKDKGQSIDTICNPIPPTVQTDRVTKTATKGDKGKGIMIEEEHIHKGKGIMFPDGGTNSDDNSFEDDSSSDYEEDDNRSVVDEDELFEHNSEDEIDRYERMYAGGTMWEAEGDGKVVLKEGDMFEDKKQFLDVFKDYLRIHASPLQDGLTYMIKSISEKHSCAKTQYNPAASAAWIVKKLCEDVRAYPSTLVKFMAKLRMMRH
ncbi:hypothetical protein Cgig2_030795 [Carnegiea gigantea]|uniref:Uncharacterized protein n=1 Tax=Carnegiea gigantea TaxID=171969 RepID=A0A9Q1KSK2_9CARY|nr:hypothetical protein Cgig2_030795 [Carnegiea gigantea]